MCETGTGHDELDDHEHDDDDKKESVSTVKFRVMYRDLTCL